MAPTDETEYSLPKDVQEKRQAARKARAANNFQQEQKIYVTVNKDKGPLYECFTDSEAALDDAIHDEENNLSTELNKLYALLDSAEVRMAAVNGKKINSLLGFNEKYIKKGVDTAKSPDGFASPNETINLLSKADVLIGKAYTVHKMLENLKRDTQSGEKRAQLFETVSSAAYNAADSTHAWVESLKRDVEKQKTSADAINKKTSNVAKGDISQGDIDSATAKPSA